MTYYEPIARCGDCRHWRFYPPEDQGTCDKAHWLMKWLDADWTRVDDGCGKFERQEKVT